MIYKLIALRVFRYIKDEKKVFIFRVRPAMQKSDKIFLSHFVHHPKSLMYSDACHISRLDQYFQKKILTINLVFLGSVVNLLIYLFHN